MADTITDTVSDAIADEAKDAVAVTSGPQLCVQTRRLVDEFRAAFPETAQHLTISQSEQPYALGSCHVALPPFVVKDEPYNRYLLSGYFNRMVKPRLPQPDAVMPAATAYSDNRFWHTYVVDHELGHIHFARDKEISANRRDIHANESYADTYAVLRHWQRFGYDTGFAEALINYRAQLIGHMNNNRYAESHMTVAPLAALLALKKQGQQLPRTAQEAVKFADKHVSRTVLSNESLRELITVSGLVQTMMSGSSALQRTIMQAHLMQTLSHLVSGQTRRLAASWLESQHAFRAYEPHEKRLLQTAIDKIRNGSLILDTAPQITIPPQLTLSGL